MMLVDCPTRRGAVAVVVALLLLTAGGGVAAAAGVSVTTDPALPLLDVPFHATVTGIADGHRLYPSQHADCSGGATLASACTVTVPVAGGASAACTFNVTSTALVVDLESPRPTVPALVWCSTADPSDAPVDTLRMYVMSTDLGYFFRSANNTLTFNDATPLGTTVQVSASPSCDLPLPGVEPFTLSGSRDMPATYDGGTLYLCAAVPTVLNTVTAMALRMTLKGVDRYTITPASGVRHRTIALTPSISFSRYYLSTQRTCNDVDPQWQYRVGGEHPLYVDVPRGEHFFCGGDSDGVYSPATNTFTVLEYDVQPHAMYAGMAVALTYGLDAAGRGDELEVALSTSTDCVRGELAVGWGAAAAATWTAPRAVGTYYACVRDRGAAATAGYTSAVDVSSAPTLTFAPSPAVLGMPLSVVVSHARGGAGVFAVRLTASASASCASPAASEVTAHGGAPAWMRVPLSAAASVGYCVSNPLEDAAAAAGAATVYYALGTLATRAFRVGHGALRAGASARLVLDSDVPLARGTSVALVPAGAAAADDCAAAAASAPAAMVFAVSGASAVLSPVVFPTAGVWLVCVRLGDAGGGDVAAALLSVYDGAAAVSPAAVLVGVSTAVAVASVPPGASVTVTSSDTCARSTAVVVAAGTAGEDGRVTLSVLAAAAGALLVCVGYPTASEAPRTPAGTEVVAAAALRGAVARVYPGIAYVGEPTLLRFAGVAGLSLGGYTAVLVPDAAPCSAATSALPSVALSGPDAACAVSHGTLGGAVLAPATVHRVCVTRGVGGGYGDAGVVASAEAPVVVSEPETPARGLPVRLQLPAAFTRATGVSWYVVVGAGVECSDDLGGTTVYASGPVHTDLGDAAVFVAPAAASGVTAVRVCVAANASLVSAHLGYALGATLRLEQFHTALVYLQRGVPNVLRGAPWSVSGSLYVVACAGAECGAGGADDVCRAKMAEGVTGSASAPLEAPLGVYLLCQRAAFGGATVVVGANTTLEVAERLRLELSVPAAEVRAYVPLSVTLSGGPSAPAAQHTVTVQPASAACGAAPPAASQQLVVRRDEPAPLTITAMAAPQRIRFCVQVPGVGSVEQLAGTLLPYTAPAAVVGDRATTLTSGGGAALPDGTRAKLSRTASCADDVVGGGAAAVVGGRVTFTVAACGANAALTSLHYCEAVGGGAFASRGVVALLRSQGCSGGAGASIRDVTVAPAAAITDFGIDAAYVERPRLSASADCGVLLDAAVASVGYAPGVGERAAFHVCAVLVDDASVPFTTALPTLRVTNWAVSPTAALSRYSASRGAASPATMKLDPAAPSRETFFSAAGDCSARVGGAAGMGGASRSAVYNTTGVRGLVSVCTVAPLGGATLAVAQFLSVTPPAVLRASPAVVRGSDYAATLVVDGVPPLYSMVAGEDAAYEHSALYTSTRREVYLSSNACAAVLAGTTAAAVAPSGAVALATGGIDAGVRAVWLCAWTAAGQAVVLADVAVAPGSVYPTQYVSGARGAAVYMPGHALATVRVSASASGCGSVAGMPQFTIDAEGYGALDVWSDAGDALALGAYTLCVAAAGGGGLAPVAAVEVVAPAYFDVRGTTFIAGVPGAMALLQDLRADALEPGFSTARDCSAVSSEHGAWAAVSSTSVSVHATGVHTAGLYLCARAPVNGTLVSVPGSWGGRSRQLEFVTSPVQLPSAGWDTCTAYALDQCQPPGASAGSATAVLVVVQGDCCSAESRDRVVGRASMASGTCELTLDGERVRAYPAGAAYHVCVWDSADDAVCTTLGETRVSADCTAAGGGGGLSRGATAGVVVGCIGGVACAAAGAAVWVRCCRRRSLRAAAGPGDGDGGDDSGAAAAAAAAAGGGGAARVRWLPELWRRRGVAEERAAGDGGAAVAPAAPETRWVKNPLLLAAAYESGAVLVPDDLPAVPVTVEDRLRCLPKQEWQGRRRVAAREGEARRLVELRRGAAGRAVCLRVDMDFDAGRYRVGPDGVLRHRSESPLSDE